MRTKADKIADDLLDWADEIETLDTHLGYLENKFLRRKLSLSSDKSLQQLVKTLHIAAGMLVKND